MGLRVRRWLTVLAVIAFVAVDVALVVLAVRHTQGDPDSDTVPTLTSPSTPTTKPPTTNTTTPNEPAPGGAVMLALAQDGSVLRATGGACADGEPATLELATDGGAFTDVSPDQPPTQVLAAAAGSATVLRVVGTDRRCTPVVYRSVDAGETWTQSSDTTGTWHLLPNGGTTVHAPEREVDVGCTVTSLSPVSESNARALCDDGFVMGTADGGRDWVALGRLEGAVAVAYSTTGDALGLADEGGCPAQVYATSNGGSAWSPTSCLSGEPAQAISVTNGRAVAQVGGMVFVSTDAGATWRSRG